jgi:YggT family protein
MLGAEPGWAVLALIAGVDLVRYSIYIMIFVVIVQAVMSWVNPYTPVAPVFDAMTRPFLRPLRRFVPPMGNVDLTPLVLLLGLYVLLIVTNHLRVAAASV